MYRYRTGYDRGTQPDKDPVSVEEKFFLFSAKSLPFENIKNIKLP